MRYLLPILMIALPSSLLAGKNPVAMGQTVFIPPMIALQSAQAEDAAAAAAAVTSAAVLSDAAVEQLTARFAQATTFCSAIAQQEYVVDCFAYEYWDIAEDLSDEGAEGEVKQVIEDTARKLDAIVRENRTTALPTGRARQGGATPRVTDRALIPVAPAAVPEVAQEAVIAIEEAKTILLRASENSDRRRAQFQQVVESMDTGTILLRSL